MTPTRSKFPRAVARSVAHARQLAPVLHELARSCASNREIAEALNRRGVASPTGQPWSLAGVAAFRRRLEVLAGQPPALHFDPGAKRPRQARQPQRIDRPAGKAPPVA